MTPNRFRCETCTKIDCLFNPNEGDWESFSPESTWQFTPLVGCANHSSFQSERDNQDDNCIWMTPEEEEKRIRKHERDKVLDELCEWASPEFNELDGDGRLHKGVCISPSGRLLQKIEKLRQAGE
jgi:hypothetical protein